MAASPRCPSFDSNSATRFSSCSTRSSSQRSRSVNPSGLLAASGYSSGDAVAQGYLKVTADSAGEAQLWSHLSGQWWLVDTFDHAATSSLHVSGAFITG